MVIIALCLIHLVNYMVLSRLYEIVFKSSVSFKKNKNKKRMKCNADFLNYKKNVLERFCPDTVGLSELLEEQELQQNGVNHTVGGS